MIQSPRRLARLKSTPYPTRAPCLTPPAAARSGSSLCLHLISNLYNNTALEYSPICIWHRHRSKVEDKAEGTGMKQHTIKKYPFYRRASGGGVINPRRIVLARS